VTPADAIAGRLRALRTERGLTQATVAERSGITRTNVMRHEAGVHSPSLTSVLRLARALEVPPSALLSALDAPEVQP
jgi:transcriptional regulator with XRE-family HTH domain